MIPLDPTKRERDRSYLFRRRERVLRLFLLPSWYQVVSHGVSGLQDEILPTDHDVSRHSLAYIYLSFLPSVPPLHDRFAASDWSSFFPSLSFSCFPLRKSSISNDYAWRSLQVDVVPQQCTKKADRCNQENRFIGRCKKRSFLHLLHLVGCGFIHLWRLAKVKRRARYSENQANGLPISGLLSAFQSSTDILCRKHGLRCSCVKSLSSAEKSYVYRFSSKPRAK